MFVNSFFRFFLYFWKVGRDFYFPPPHPSGLRPATFPRQGGKGFGGNWKSQRNGPPRGSFSTDFCFPPMIGHYFASPPRSPHPSGLWPATCPHQGEGFLAYSSVIALFGGRGYTESTAAFFRGVRPGLPPDGERWHGAAATDEVGRV